MCKSIMCVHLTPLSGRWLQRASQTKVQVASSGNSGGNYLAVVSSSKSTAPLSTGSRTRCSVRVHVADSCWTKFGTTPLLLSSQTHLPDLKHVHRDQRAPIPYVFLRTWTGWSSRQLAQPNSNHSNKHWAQDKGNLNNPLNFCLNMVPLNNYNLSTSSSVVYVGCC